MIKSILRWTLCVTVAGTILGTSPRALASDDGALIKQAEALLKQAWNPGGDPPSDAQRTDLLKQAIELAQKEPDHRLAGTRMRAIQSMQAALEEIKAGNTAKATSDMHDADSLLRTAIGMAEGH